MSSTIAEYRSKIAALSDAKKRGGESVGFSNSRTEKILAETELKLNAGLPSEAEIFLNDALENKDLSAEERARLLERLAYTLETLGRYQESLNTLADYETKEKSVGISVKTQIEVLTRLAAAFNYIGDRAGATRILDGVLPLAKSENKAELYGKIYYAYAVIHIKFDEFSNARESVEKSLEYYRESGEWSGIAAAYQLLGKIYNREGACVKAIESWKLAIDMIGKHSAPYLLGKIYADMAGAYWFIRQPQEGIECLEKSIEYFDKTEHILNSIIAYNNLGLNLTLLGEWDKAEEIIKKALDLAIEADHVFIAGILDTYGELKFLQGDLDAARELLEEAVRVAAERKSAFDKTQAQRNLARILLALGKTSEAVESVGELIAECDASGAQLIANMARLVLAEGLLRQGNLKTSERELQRIEATDPKDDFFVLGHIQRIRGLAAVFEEDRKLALHHFNRALTIFETANDLYHTALAHLSIGRTTGAADTRNAIKHLLAASETFRRLGVENLFQEAEENISELNNLKTEENVGGDFVKSNTEAGINSAKPANAASQLYLVRLAEATASRELLFRELIAVLQQESRARKILIAERNEEKSLYPFITHGYLPAESMKLTEGLKEARTKNTLEEFSRINNIKIFELKTPSAPPALLAVYPLSGAVLNDGGSLQPLLRVVGLGMDVCALRERDHIGQSSLVESSVTAQSLMPGFIHSSPAMANLVEEVYKIRSSDVTVLVTGESGTGKELVSRAIHVVSNRKDQIFVPFNCTAVPKELAEGHLFGYRRGAFTGAVNDSPGIIRAADGGTLFLDEIGDLPIDVQPKLLRFLQEGEVQPIGEKKPETVDVRVIAATNMQLEQKVEQGLFREDLYYRLNVIRLRVPPLRERRSEIPPMINYYINHYSTRFGKSGITVTPQTIDLLMVCDWEGNVRQLCNEIQRVVARAVNNEIITPEHLSGELKMQDSVKDSDYGGNVRTISSHTGSFFQTANTGMTIEQAVSELETQMINDALRRHEWNISRVARELGITRRGLYLKIERYQIERAA